MHAHKPLPTLCKHTHTHTHLLFQGAKGFEKAEDPIYALDHNLPIDCQHYLEHHVKQPLLRIFEPVLKNPTDLLTGACGCVAVCVSL